MSTAAPYWDGPSTLVIEAGDLEKLLPHLPSGFQRQLRQQIDANRRGEKVYVHVLGKLGHRRLVNALDAEGLVGT